MSCTLCFQTDCWLDNEADSRVGITARDALWRSARTQLANKGENHTYGHYALHTCLFCKAVSCALCQERERVKAARYDEGRRQKERTYRCECGTVVRSIFGLACPFCTFPMVRT